MRCLWTLVTSSLLFEPRIFKTFLRKTFLLGRKLSTSKANIDLPKNKTKAVEPGHVYFVATPIGNLGDMSMRAIQVLSEVDTVCAEDTRHTRNLLNHLNLGHKYLLSHHEFNYKEQIPKIMGLIAQGQSIAVVSDAGTPGISDPGQQLAEACALANVPLHPVPGPSAVVAAVSVSGFSGSAFSFHGFLPVKGKERADKLKEISSLSHTVVFFEAPHRIKETLTELAGAFEQGPRQVVCCREITKLHEEFWRGTVAASLAWVEGLESNDQLRVRGEFTVVLGPAEGVQTSAQVRDEKVLAALRALRHDGLARSEAVKLVCAMLEAPKSVVYKLALDESWD